MARKDPHVFRPDIPPDLEHAPLIREEALDWLEMRNPGTLSFPTADVLRMAGETGRRWLIARLRAQGIGNEAEFNLADAANALSVLYLRFKGVKFRDAVESVVGRKDSQRGPEPRYGGLWNRLIISTVERLRRRIPPRLIGCAVVSFVRDQKDQTNCLLIVRRGVKKTQYGVEAKTTHVNHDYAYRAILERPAPSCMVMAPSREILFLPDDQLPARSEVTARHFVSIRITTELESYELLLGTMAPLTIQPDDSTLRFVGRILDIVFVLFEEFEKAQASSRPDIPVQPDHASADDLQLWLVAQFLAGLYGGALCEISEISPATHQTRVLASSAARPWEPAPWEPAKSLEMLSGYASLTGVPLVVEKVEPPWTRIVESVDSELRYLRSRAAKDRVPSSYSALALPIGSSFGNLVGSLYMLIPKQDARLLDVEVRILEVMSRIIGEVIERQRAAVYSAAVAADIAANTILSQQQFESSLLDLLGRKAAMLREEGQPLRDLRLPFLLLSAYRPGPDEFDPAVSGPLKDWLVHTLRHLEWRSFVRGHLGDTGYARDAFVGEVPGVGLMIAMGELVSKDELDRIRGAFPTTINRASPSNAPVRLVAWVLDVPAQRIVEADARQDVAGLADEIVRWAFEVTTLVDDVAQSAMLAHEQGEWEAALHRVRQALNKQGGRSNAYLRRLAADCCFALGDWPGARKYAQAAARLSRTELGSGLVRSLCLEADAYLCLGDPRRAWDVYCEAVSVGPGHPLPRYYRGQALLLMGRLLHVYENERRRAAPLPREDAEQIDSVVATLVDAAMEDLTSAADLLDHWGLIPESYQYRNFHLVPTLLGQGTSYLLTRSPGPAASRLQSARRSFPKDDLFFREFLFAKCWEQGLHRQYATILLGEGWTAFRERLQALAT